MTVTDYPDFCTEAENARQISITGAPLLLKQGSLASATSATVPASGFLNVPASGVLATNQPTVDLFLNLAYSGSNGASPFASLIVSWFDQTGNFVMWRDSFVVVCGPVGSPFPNMIRLPVKGYSFAVNITNLDSIPMLATYNLVATSFPVADVEYMWDMSSFLPTPPGQTLPNAIYPDGRVLCTRVNGTLAHGVTDSIIVPPCAGPMYVNFQQTGVVAANITVRLNPIPNSVYTNGGITSYLINDVPVAGNATKLSQVVGGVLGPCNFRVANNDGAASASFAVVISRA